MPVNLPTDLLRTFVAVAECGSITEAGDLLGRSQPAISLQIKRLEELLDLKLIQRGGKKLVMTDRGRVLFSYAEKILGQNDEVVARLTSPRVSGHVHLGLPNEFAASFLPRVLRRYAKAHPLVTVKVTCDLSVNLQSRLQNGEFDLVLALDDGNTHPHVACRWQEPVVWAGSPDTVIDKHSPIPLIVASEGCLYRSRIFNTLAKTKINWRIAYTSPNLSGIRAGVSADLGITAMAESTVTDGLQILDFPGVLPKLPDVQMHLLFDGKRLPDAARHLIDHIDKCVKTKTQIS